MPPAQRAREARVNPVWYQYACATVVAAVLVGNVLRWAFLDWSDPYHCSAVLNTGKWLDPGTYTNWQPEGCFHAPLASAALVECLSSPGPNTPASTAIRVVQPRRRALFIGDSVVRQLFFAAVRKVDGGKGGVAKGFEDGEKHSDRQIVVESKTGQSVTMEFWWDPYLNTSQTASFLSSTPAESTSLLVLGSGLWYLRNPSSGGLAAWGSTIHSTFETLKERQGSPRTPLSAPWDDMAAGSGVRLPGLLPDGAQRKRQLLGGGAAAAPSSPHDFGLSDAVVFLPIAEPVEARLSPARAQTIVHADVEAMNADLAARLTHANPPPVVVPAVFNRLLAPAETEDGLHYSDRIVDKQAELLLAWRCNDAVRARSSQGACCRRYSAVRPVQALILLALCVWAPLSILIAPRLREWRRSVWPRPGGASQCRMLHSVGRVEHTELAPAHALTSRSRWLSRPPPRPSARSRRVRLRDRLPLPRGPHEHLPKGAEGLRRVHVWRPHARRARRRPRDHAAHAKGPRLPEPRPDRRVEGLDADRHFDLPLFRRVEDLGHLQPDPRARRVLPVHDWLWPLLLLLQKGRLWLPARRHGPLPAQPALGRPALHDEHRLRVLLLCAARVVVVPDHLRDHGARQQVQRPAGVPRVQAAAVRRRRHALHALHLAHGRHFRPPQRRLPHPVERVRMELPRHARPVHCLGRHVRRVRVHQDQGARHHRARVVPGGVARLARRRRARHGLVLLVRALAPLQVCLQQLPRRRLGRAHHGLRYAARRDAGAAHGLVGPLLLCRPDLARDVHPPVPRLARQRHKGHPPRRPRHALAPAQPRRLHRRLCLAQLQGLGRDGRDYRLGDRQGRGRQEEGGGAGAGAAAARHGELGRQRRGRGRGRRGRRGRRRGVGRRGRRRRGRHCGAKGGRQRGRAGEHPAHEPGQGGRRGRRGRRGGRGRAARSARQLALAGMSGRTAERYAGGRARGWRGQTLPGALGSVGALAREHNGVKLALVLVGLWVLNWVY